MPSRNVIELKVEAALLLGSDHIQAHRRHELEATKQSTYKPRSVLSVIEEEAVNDLREV
jgi:hypothetical protein